MASSSSEIADFLASRGLNLRQDDVDEVAAMLASLPVDEHDRIAPNVWEVVAQIIADPLFEGDIVLPFE